MLYFILNILITLVTLRIYSSYLTKELEKMENRINEMIQLEKTISQKDLPSSVKK